MATNTFALLILLFYEPTKTFVALKERPVIWIPLFTLLLTSIFTMLWYFNTVNFEWLREYILEAHPGIKSDARRVMGHYITKNFMVISTSTGILVGTPLMLIIHALYFTIASRIIDVDIGFKKWFSFAVWINIPSILIIPSMVVQIIWSNGRTPIEDLNMLSINYLIGSLPNSNLWSNLLNSLSLATFWTIFVSFVGIKSWTKKNNNICINVIILPYFAIYLVWVAKIIVAKYI